MTHPWEGRSPSAIGQRLRLTREALGLTMKDFALAAGMLPNHLSEVEAGKKAIGLDKVRALKDTFGLTLDWVYDGDMQWLPHKLVTAIRALQGLRADDVGHPPPRPTAN